MTVRSALPLLLVSAVMLAGCAEDRDYRISHATVSDAAKTREILREVAAEAGLPGDANHSVGNYRTLNVSLEAEVSGDHIDISLSRSDWPPPRAFKKAGQLLDPALSLVFGRRLTAPKLPHIERLVTF